MTDGAITSALAGLVLAGAVAALAIADPGSATFSGRATVVDGDSLRVSGVPVRLFGIDAPEMAQRCYDAQARSYACGQAAADALRYMLARDPHVICERKDQDHYGRTVARCSNAGGDLGARQVSIGMAVAYRRYSSAYVDHEAAAKTERLGMHGGTFQQPAAWRREHKGNGQ